jgi:hypothetical protein
MYIVLYIPVHVHNLQLEAQPTEPVSLTWQ